MTKTKKKLLFWGIVFVALFGFLYLIRSILLPFVLSFILAYLLNPLSQKLSKKRGFKTIAPFVVVCGFVLSLLAVIVLLVPILESQVATFAAKVPGYASRLWNWLVPIADHLQDYLSADQMETLKQNLSVKSLSVLEGVGKALRSIFSGGMIVFDVITFIVITPVVTFYLLNDWDKIKASVNGLFPKQYASVIQKKLIEMDTLLSAFIRGQAIVCLVLGLIYGIGLTVIGVDLGFAVGFISGVFSFVPYLGTLTGFVLSLLLAATQGAAWAVYAGILVVFGVGQFLEGYVLTPKLVGDKVGLHPVWIIFALFAGGALFGFLGVLLAVPVLTIIKVLWLSALASYKESQFYKGKK